MNEMEKCFEKVPEADGNTVEKEPLFTCHDLVFFEETEKDSFDGNLEIRVHDERQLDAIVTMICSLGIHTYFWMDKVQITKEGKKYMSSNAINKIIPGCSNE